MIKRIKSKYATSQGTMYIAMENYDFLSVSKNRAYELTKYLDMITSSSRVQTREVPLATAKKTIATTTFYLPAQLYGAWSRSLADPLDPTCAHATQDEICFPNDSEEIVFSVVSNKNMYSSYLHGRPDLSGCIWILQGNKVKVTCSQGSNSDLFTIISVGAGTLSITRGEISDVEIYRKIKN